MPNANPLHQRPLHRRGIRSRHLGHALITCTVLVIAMIGFCSLAVDYGRAKLVKMELARCADAAALAALQELQNGNGPDAACTVAQNIASANLVDGLPVALDVNNDIEFGNYDDVTDTFTVLYGSDRSTATAIHIICNRIASRGTAVPLYFAPVIGITSTDVTADAVASLNAPSAFGIVGIQSFDAHSTDFDSFDSTLGAYGGTNVHGNAPLATSGQLTFTNSCHVHSEAHPGAGASITKDGGTQINASQPFNSGNYPILSPNTASITSTLYYPAVPAPTTGYDNTAISSKMDASGNFTVDNNISIPGGTYVVNNFTIAKDKTLNCNGAVTFYVKGNFYDQGVIKTYLWNTHYFLIYMTNPNTSFEHVKANQWYASVYAPLTDITIDDGDLFGQVIGKTLSCSAKHIHYDESFRDGTIGGPAKKKFLKHPWKWKRKVGQVL